MHRIAGKGPTIPCSGSFELMARCVAGLKTPQLGRSLVERAVGCEGILEVLDGFTFRARARASLPMLGRIRHLGDIRGLKCYLEG